MKSNNLPTDNSYNPVSICKIILDTPLIVDPKVINSALNGIMDFIACSFQAQNHPDCQKLLTWLTNDLENKRHLLIGQNLSTSARQAALFNAFQAHVLDYDDSHTQVRGHPSAIILSSLFSSIDLHDPTSQIIPSPRLLSAYIIGVEIMARFGEVIGNQLYINGWHNTSILGVIGATVALCYLHQLAPNLTSQALTLAITQASGLRLVFGSVAKSLNVAVAAQAAIQAFEWIKLGLTSPENFLDPKYGFLAIYGEQQHFALDNWGKSWRIHNPGLWFKTYTFCSAAAYVADAAKSIREQHKFNITAIKKIEIIFPKHGDEALIYTKPTSKIEGQFSAEYIAALFLYQQNINIEHFTNDVIENDIQQLINKSYRSYEHHTTTRYVKLIVTTHTGVQYQSTITKPKGSHANPYPPEELTAKFTQAIDNQHKSQAILLAINKLALADNKIIDLLKLIN